MGVENCIQYNTSFLCGTCYSLCYLLQLVCYLLQLKSYPSHLVYYLLQLKAMPRIVRGDNLIIAAETGKCV